MPKKENFDSTHFRVAIFGSARIKRHDPRYNTVFTLAKMIAQSNMDIVTGGGPGLMDAASRGHHTGRKGNHLHTLGLKIHLPKEQKDSYHLDIKREFYKFSDRLDNFMKLCDAVVVAPGGIGTHLELFYTWQLVQVHEICETPIILLGKHWEGLINWIKKEVLSKKLMNKEDLDFIFVARNPREAMTILRRMQQDTIKNKHICRNFQEYKKTLRSKKKK